MSRCALFHGQRSGWRLYGVQHTRDILFRQSRQEPKDQSRAQFRQVQHAADGDRKQERRRAVLLGGGAGCRVAVGRVFDNVKAHPARTCELTAPGVAIVEPVSVFQFPVDLF